NVLADAAPAELDWTTQLAAGVQFDKAGDEAMQLSADKAAAVSWASVKVPHTGLYEVVFRLGEVSPGTGFFLGDESGKPVHVLGILRDQRTGQNVLGFVPPNAAAFDTNVDLNVQPCSYTTAGQWVRLVAGSGTLKCWVSGDGLHWGRAFDPARNVPGGWSHVWLVSFQTNDARRIALEHLRISELRAISSLADEKLIAQVPESVITAEPNPAAWQTRVKESLPAETNLVAWRT